MDCRLAVAEKAADAQPKQSSERRQGSASPRSTRRVERQVPPGAYKLTIDAWPQDRSDGGVIGQVDREFSVPNIPGGYNEEPLELGAVTAKLIDALEPGDVIP